MPAAIASSSVSRNVLDHVGRLALQPARPVVRARVGAVVLVAADVEPEVLEQRAVLVGRRAERR
jgi:hypothetical protein